MQTLASIYFLSVPLFTLFTQKSNNRAKLRSYFKIIPFDISSLRGPTPFATFSLTRAFILSSMLFSFYVLPLPAQLDISTCQVLPVSICPEVESLWK